MPGSLGSSLDAFGKVLQAGFYWEGPTLIEGSCRAWRLGVVSVCGRTGPAW